METERPWQDEETLRELYVDKDMTATAVSDELGCNKTTVGNWLDRHGIEKHKTTVGELCEKEEWIRKRYWDDGKSIDDIATEYGCNRISVRTAMIRQGIERRDYNEPGSSGLYFYVDAPAYERVIDYSDEDRPKAMMHRLMAVSMWGFDEIKGKEVHHKNEVKWDNRPSNLQLMTPSEHMRHHRTNGN